MPTNFMNLVLPTVSVTLGPEWATELNDALDVIDAHDHSSGKGTQVKAAGLNVDDDLSFNNSKAYELSSAQFHQVDAPLTGASNAASVSTFADDLYYTNGAGISVQITSGGSVITSPGTFSTLSETSVNTNLTIGPADTFVFLRVDTSTARTITLPLASAVAAGRVYIIKDVTGSANANPITITRAGSDTIDGASTSILDSTYGSTWVVGNGVDSWDVA